MIQNWKNRLGFLAALAIGASFLLSACGSKDQFVASQVTEYFLQDYNPAYVDILWVLDDRSPLHNIQGHLTQEASFFFKRLDQSTSQYRLGLISADMQFAQGQLKTQAPLTKLLGTVEQRTSVFSSLISNVINLATGAENRGFEAAWRALNTTFVPRSKVPLVMVFVSDGDDISAVPTTQNAVDYYEAAFLSLKNNVRDLIKVYSINYYPISSGGTRCATQYNADIDKPGFQDRYFRMAARFTGDKADICGTFASKIDLTGLKLKTLPKVFTLTKQPKVDTLVVTVSLIPTSEEFKNLKWTYDQPTNSIIFNNTPPEGTTISVTYLPE